MTEETLQMCPRCHVGIDDDGDGNCGLCAGIPEKFTPLLGAIFKQGEKAGRSEKKDSDGKQ